MYEYSSVARIWYEIKLSTGSRPSPRYRFDGVIKEREIFLFGGVNSEKKRFQDLFKYNIDRRSWSMIAAKGSFPSARSFHRCALSGSHMIVFGGLDGKRQNDIYIFNFQDIESDKNTSPGYMKSPSSVSQRSVTSKRQLFSLEDESKDKKKKKLLKYYRILNDQIRELSFKLKLEEQRKLCKVEIKLCRFVTIRLLIVFI